MRPLLRFVPVLIALAIPWLSPSLARAAWPHDPILGNVPLCTAANDQNYPTPVSDGAGGAIVSWMDFRSGSGDIYVQRVNTAGVPQWTTNGVALCNVSNASYTPTIVSDGAGGAIVTWQDHRSTAAIYAQRVNAAGVPQWTTNGVALCTAAGSRYLPTIVSDGAGGAIVTWFDSRTTNYDIYAQRVNATGAVQWTPDGVALCTAASDQSYPMIASDGAGGAIVTWYDFRNGGSTGFDIYAQRVSAAGVVQWTANGVALCIATNSQLSPGIVSDGAGGAFVAWQDARLGGANYDIYAQRVNAAGVAQWTTDGVALCTAPNNQGSTWILADGAGGAIVAWCDARGGTYNDIYAQRVSVAGAAQWTASGVPLCTAAYHQYNPKIASDGAGGAIVTWYDLRGGSYSDIYAQRVSAAGVVQWTAGGVELCTAAADQSYPRIASDGAGGAIVAWQDARSGNFDIYAQRVDRFGYLGAEPVIASVGDVPNDQGGKVKVSWYASYLDLGSDPNLAAYDVYRSAPAGYAETALRSGARALASFAEVPTPGERGFVVEPSSVALYAWEYLATVNAVHFLEAYGYIAPTTGDSIAGSNPPTIFMVVGRNASGSMYWLSAPDSGYSVDDLSPTPPGLLTGNCAAGATRLHWAENGESDLAGYRLYRGSTEDFVPGPGTLVSAQADTGYSDVASCGSYYKLSAVDVHGNESGFALLAPGATTDVGGSVTPRDLAFAAPRPNPARTAALLCFALPQAGPVRLAVYDMGGRLVRTVSEGRLEAGQYQLPFDLRDGGGRRAPNGLYFVRLEAGGRRLVQRLAIVE